MKQRKKINQIKEYKECVCEYCGETTNKDDGWCFKCSTTPKSIPINLIDKNELLKVLEEELKDEQEVIKRLKGILNWSDRCGSDEI